MWEPRFLRTATTLRSDMPHPGLNTVLSQGSDAVTSGSIGRSSGDTTWRFEAHESLNSGSVDLPTTISEKSDPATSEAQRVSFAPAPVSYGDVQAGRTHVKRMSASCTTASAGSASAASSGQLSFSTTHSPATTTSSPLSRKRPEEKNAKIKKGGFKKSKGTRLSDYISDAVGNNQRLSASSAGSCAGRETVGRDSVVPAQQKPKTQGVFADASALKAKVLQNLKKPEYNVFDFYHQTGCMQAVARHPLFEQITILIISANAFWIMIDTDNNDAKVLTDAKPVFVVAENAFCTYFTTELFIRFASFKRKRNCLRDGWFVFDSVLVALMVLETWVMVLIVKIMNLDGNIGDLPAIKLFRLVRLSRVARMARLLKSVPELMILIKGMATAMRSVCFTLLLLALNVYVFAIFFTQLCQEAETDVRERYFENVPHSMYTLMLRGVLLDSPAYVTESLGKESHIYVGLFFIFVLFGALTVMNLLIGVLCEVVGVVAAVEKEEMLVSLVRSRLQSIVEELDENGDNKISRNEFNKLLENGDAAVALNEVGVDVVGLVDMADFIFDPTNSENPLEEDEEVELSFGDFMAVVLSLRGSNTATVKDVVDLRKYVRTTSCNSASRMDESHKHLRRLEEHLVRIENLIVANMSSNLQLPAMRCAGHDNHHVPTSKRQEALLDVPDITFGTTREANKESMLIPLSRLNELEGNHQSDAEFSSEDRDPSTKDNLRKLGEAKPSHMDKHRLSASSAKLKNRSKQQETIGMEPIAEDKKLLTCLRSPTREPWQLIGDAGQTPRDAALTPRQHGHTPCQPHLFENDNVIFEQASEEGTVISGDQSTLDDSPLASCSDVMEDRTT